jgi:hypothetical protein
VNLNRALQLLGYPQDGARICVIAAVHRDAGTLQRDDDLLLLNFGVEQRSRALYPTFDALLERWPPSPTSPNGGVSGVRQPGA